MPTYLVHGFRWHRTSIRIHIILQDLEDAAAEWIVAPATSITLLNSFYSLYDFLPPSNPPRQPSGHRPSTSFPLPPPTPDESSFHTTGTRPSTAYRPEEHHSHTLPRPSTAHRLNHDNGLILPRSSPSDPHAMSNDLPSPSHQTPINHTASRQRQPIPSFSYPRPPPIPDNPAEFTPPKVLKRNKSMVSLRSLRRKQKTDVSEKPPPMPTLERKSSIGTSSSDMRSSRTGSINRRKPETPTTFNQWSAVKLLEQHDPADETVVSQPYAYVADYMLEIKLGVSIAEEMVQYQARAKAEEAPLTAPSMSNIPGTPDSSTMSARDIRRKSKTIGWLEKLRDNLQKGEDIGWYIVVCGDESRDAPTMRDFGRSRTSTTSEDSRLRNPRSVGLRGFFGRKKSFMDQ